MGRRPLDSASHAEKKRLPSVRFLRLQIEITGLIG